MDEFRFTKVENKRVIILTIATCHYFARGSSFVASYFTIVKVTVLLFTRSVKLHTPVKPIQEISLSSSCPNCFEPI